MKKTDYPNMLLTLLSADPQSGERIYKEIYTALAEDFCPPFDRGALILLAIDLYALSLERTRDTRLDSALRSAILSLCDVRSRKYGAWDASEYIKICTRKERTQREVYLSCIRSFMIVMASRL